MSCHPAAADGPSASLSSAQGSSFGQMVLSPFPRNRTGSRASFPPDSMKSPKIPMLISLLYKPSRPASPASHFPLPPCSLSCLLLPKLAMAPDRRRCSATPPSSEHSSSWEATPRRWHSPRHSVVHAASQLGVRGTHTTCSAASARRQLLSTLR